MVLLVGTIKTIVACCNGVLSLQEEATVAQGAKARVSRAEQALEALLDAQLARRTHVSAEDEDDCSSSGDFPTNFKDDYVDSDIPESDSDDGVTVAHHNETIFVDHQQALARQCNGASQCESKQSTAKSPAWEPVIDDGNPLSFSQVDLSRPENEIRTRFPLFPVRFLTGPFCMDFFCLLSAAQL